MRFITKRSIPRRTFIKGAGASLALPLLDAMIPAATASSKTVAAGIRRLGYVFMPMGCDQSRWTPKSENNLDELSPILDSLEPVKHKTSILTNMELRPAYPGSHATSNSSFLSAVKAKVSATAARITQSVATPVALKTATRGKAGLAQSLAFVEKLIANFLVFRQAFAGQLHTQIQNPVPGDKNLISFR